MRLLQTVFLLAIPLLNVLAHSKNSKQTKEAKRGRGENELFPQDVYAKQNWVNKPVFKE